MARSKQQIEEDRIRREKVDKVDNQTTWICIVIIAFVLFITANQCNPYYN